MIGSTDNELSTCMNAEQACPGSTAKRSDDSLVREGLLPFVEGGHDVADLDLLNRLAINERASGKALVNDHQLVAETRQGLEMLGPADRLHAGHNDRRAPFVPACAHLPDDCGRIDHAELIRRLLQQLLPLRNDERLETEAAAGFRKHQGFAAACGKHEQGPASLGFALIGVKDPLNARFLIGPQRDGRERGVRDKC